MSTTTQCPACGTRFKATQAQLEAFHGMVRCGHCHAAFNAIENRTSSNSGPQLNLPIVEEDLSAQEEQGGKAAPARKPAAPGRAEDFPELPDTRRRDWRKWAWSSGSVLLAGLLTAQLMFLFRVELAARLPGLKLTLVAACAKLHCSVPLPRNADLMAIETSNMETDPAQPGVITLTVVLRNLAGYVQEYPNLELTLTDINDTALGRRILQPAEYLKDPSEAKNGLAANRQSEIRLAIDASTLKPVGYRLFLSYQQAAAQ